MNCKHCSKPTTNNSYCDNTCQAAARTSKLIAGFDDGSYIGKHLQFKTGGWQRQALIDRFGYKCAACGISEYNGAPLTLEVNHKDGDALNNVYSNLEFLCPNCHSQTPNFRALNYKRSTRMYRSKPV